MAPKYQLSHIAGTLPSHTALPRRLTRVLVAGGSGFIGSHMCEAFLENGVEVVCVDNLVTGTVENIAHLRESPLFSLLVQDASEPLGDMAPLDAILHLASPASPPDFERLSVETLRAGSHITSNLLELAAAHKARFLLASTSEVYGDAKEHPQNESYWGHVNPIGPRSVYDEGKRFAEALVTAYHHRYDVDSVIVRIFNTYGPRMRPDDGRVVPTFITQALAGEGLTVAGDGQQSRSLCYVEDLIRGLLAAVLSDHHGPINLGNPDEDSILGLARRIIALCDSSSALRFVGRMQDDPSRRCPDIALAAEVLNWRPRIGQDEGLTRTIDWLGSRLGHPHVTARPGQSGTDEPRVKV